MASIADTTEAQFDTLFDTRVKGMFFLTQALLPVVADGGGIVNFSTGPTRVSFAGFAAYAAAKGTVEVLTVYLANGLGARGIRANTVAPGAIETDFLGGAVRDMPDLNRQFAAMTALGRAACPTISGRSWRACSAPTTAGSTASASKCRAGRRSERPQRRLACMASA